MFQKEAGKLVWSAPLYVPLCHGFCYFAVSLALMLRFCLVILCIISIVYMFVLKQAILVLFTQIVEHNT